jgi:hypothetical protein
MYLLSYASNVEGCTRGRLHHAFSPPHSFSVTIRNVSIAVGSALRGVTRLTTGCAGVHFGASRRSRAKTSDTTTASRLCEALRTIAATRTGTCALGVIPTRWVCAGSTATCRFAIHPRRPHLRRRRRRRRLRRRCVELSIDIDIARVCCSHRLSGGTLHARQTRLGGVFGSMGRPVSNWLNHIRTFPVCTWLAGPHSTPVERSQLSCEVS